MEVAAFFDFIGRTSEACLLTSVKIKGSYTMQKIIIQMRYLLFPSNVLYPLKLHTTLD